MFILLLLVPFFLLFLIFYKREICWRSAALSSAVVWGLLLSTITELLSIFTLLTLGWILGLWGLASIVLCSICIVSIKKSEPIIHLKITKGPISLFSISLLLCTIFIVTIVGLIAFIAPPNTVDSMDYHMSRVVHWIQNHSIAFYPTQIERQLYLKPWAEFAITHLQILSGGDRFANLVQWFSMVGSILGVSLIAKQFGANTPVQLFAAIVSATIPMGILQASSTQNDYVVSFWLVCLVYYLILLKKQPGYPHALAAGASLGLAIFTKPTAYIYAAPFLIWFGLSQLKTLRWRVLQLAMTIVIVALLINLGHYIRNFDLYGHPLGLVEGEEKRNGSGIKLKVSNDIFTFSAITSNAIRNLGLHTGTPFLRVSDFTERGIRFLHRFLGIEVDDSRTTFPTFRNNKFYLPGFNFHEDTAGNFIHLILIFVSVVLFFIRGWKRESHELINYGVAVIAAFLLFCLYLKWEIWNSRYHLPLFVLWSPFIAVALSRILKQEITNFIAIFLLFSALPWVMCNQTRPLFTIIKDTKTPYITMKYRVSYTNGSIFNTSRIDQYFFNNPGSKSHYIEATDFLKSQKCSHIGLYMDNWSAWEYQLWVLLQENNTHSVRIEHVNVKKNSSVKHNQYPFNEFSPCAIVALSLLNFEQTANIFTRESVYAQVWSSNSISIFTKW
jgi:4-amino-4-deoxy-L-arabinose transferase-like glycosyltransferase